MPEPDDRAPAWRRYLRFWRADIGADVDDELAFHLEMRARDLEARGMSARDARLEAARQFGAVATVRDACLTIDQRRARRAHRSEVISDMWHDFKFALRTFRTHPGFTAAIAATLAVGIGASTAMFSLIDATLLRPLPFAAPDRLMVLWGTKGPERAIRGASFPEVGDWRATSRSFTDVSLYDQISLNLRTNGEPLRLSAEMVAAGYFPLLGASAARGRTFLPEEDRAPDTHPVAIISDHMWRTVLGGDAGAVGSTIVLNDRPLTVVGIMPPDFRGVAFTTDVWVPSMMIGLTSAPSIIRQRGSRWLMAIGRLRPGVSAAQAQRDLDGVASRLAQSYPETNTGRGVQLMSLRANYLGGTRSMLVTLFGAVVLFLLLTCVNVTSLQLVRAVGRRQEIAIRIALGANRGRLVRQLLAEGLAIAGLGGVAGALVAYAGVRLLTPLIPDGLLPSYAHVAVDARALAFTLGVAIIAGLVCGLAPALTRARTDLTGALKDGARASSGGLSRLGRAGVQQQLVVGQIALALMLLVSAGLMLRSLRQQLAVSTGFRADGVLAARVTLPGQRYPAAARLAFAEQLLARIEALPTVRSASISSDLPFGGNTSAATLVLPEGDQEGIRFYRHVISPDFFATLGIPLKRGRAFTAADREGTPAVAIVTDAMVKRVWPAADPIGRRLRLGDASGPEVIIVGVVEAARFRDLTTNLAAAGSEPDVYFPLAQRPSRELEIAVREKSGAPLSRAALQGALAAIDPTLPLFGVRALADDVRGQTATGRFGSLTLMVFSIVALLLAAIGIYGVVAFVVERSRREIAIRMAIGAHAENVVRMILRGGLVLAGAGIVIGVALSTLLTPLLASQLFGVSNTDPLTYAAVITVVLLVAFAATYLPARRATRVAPQQVLRSE